MTVVSFSNSGFPFAGQTRIAGGLAQPYVPSGDSLSAGGPEDRFRDFEKVFEEFLSGVNRREEREKEDAGTQAREAVPRDTGTPRGTDSLGEAEAPRGAEVPQDAEIVEKKDLSREIVLPAEGETLADDSRFPRFDAAAGGEFEEFRRESGESSPEDFFLPGGLALWALGKSGESGLQAQGGTAAETVMSEGGGLPAELAEGHAGEEGIFFREGSSGLPVKNGPAPKNGGGEGAESPVSAVSQKAADLPKEELQGPAGSLFERPAEVRDGKIRSDLAVSGEKAGGIRLFASFEHEKTGEETSPVIPAQVPGSERETEKGREGRGSGRRKVELRDQREKPSAELSVSPVPESPGQSPGQSKAEIHTEILSRDFTPADINAPGEGAAESGGRVFEDALARELRQSLNSDIVRHAQLVLRDKGGGLIRLSLRPESLGNVKIRLELTENKIAGRIIVESAEALRAFEREIASLERTFRDSGYESAELSAFLSQDGSGGGQEEDKPFYSPRFALDRARYDELLERMDTSFSGLSENGLGPGNGHIQINMLI